MYTIIVKRRLLNIKCHLRLQGTTHTWIPENAWVPCAISFHCMEIRPDEEHWLLFPSFVTRPEGRRDSCGYMCTWGGGWFASPLDYLVISYEENIAEVLLCGLAAELSALNECRFPCDASVQHYSRQICRCWQQFWWDLYSCCIFNNYRHECWHYIVIMWDECWQISTFPQIALDKLCKSYCALCSMCAQKDFYFIRIWPLAWCISHISRAAFYNWSSTVNLWDWGEVEGNYSTLFLTFRLDYCNDI